MEKKYNMRSPGVKRLMREAIELKDPTPMYFTQPLEDNLFEWHFTILGPKDSEFEGGHYHGRIILPTEYPMKPPSIIMLTPNGRFELHQKICLSASEYHPELWQPSWSIRTVLLAIIGFMPTKGAGAVASMDCSPEDRMKMARRSLDWVCPVCGVANRNLLPQFEQNSSQEAMTTEAADIVAQMAFKSEAEVKAQKQQLASESQQKQKQPPAQPDEGNRQQLQQKQSSEDSKQLPQRTAMEGETGADSVTSATHTQDSTDGRGLRPRRAEVGVTSPTHAPLTRAHTAQNSADRGKGGSLVLIWVLLVVILALAARRLLLM